MRSAIKPPPNNIADLQQWRADILERVRELFSSYGLATDSSNQDNANWQRLAIRMAIRRQEPGFILAHSVESQSSKSRERELRDSLMERFIWSVETRDEQGRVTLEMRERPAMTETKAAKATVHELERLKRLSFYKGFIPTFGAVREQYNKRKNECMARKLERPGNTPPQYVIDYLGLSRMLEEIEEVTALI